MVFWYFIKHILNSQANNSGPHQAGSQIRVPTSSGIHGKSSKKLKCMANHGI